MKKYYLDSGCSSLLLGVKKFRKIRTIFLPEFICNNLPESLEKNKYLVRYYKVLKDLKTDWSDLKLKLKKYKDENILILYVNYFSKINERNKFVKLKKHYKIKLVEDNSHGFYLNINNENVKKIDLFISSPKKIFSDLYSGGILYNKKSDILDKIYRKIPHKEITYFNILKQNIKDDFKDYRFFKKMKIIKKNFGIYKNDKKYEGVYKIDLKSKKNLIQKNLINELNKKKNRIVNYNKILKNFKYTEIVESSNQTNIPWYFAIITKTYNEKKTIIKYCSSNQIENFNWPDLPKKNINERTKSIYNKLICFPL